MQGTRNAEAVTIIKELLEFVGSSMPDVARQLLRSSRSLCTSAIHLTAAIPYDVERCVEAVRVLISVRTHIHPQPLLCLWMSDFFRVPVP